MEIIPDFMLKVNTQHGTQMGFGASNFDLEDIVGVVDELSLREELEYCNHFLTDTVTANGRHRFFNFVMSSFSSPLLSENWIMYSKNLNVLQKLTLHLDSF